MLTEYRLNADSVLPGKMRGAGVRPWCWEVAGFLDCSGLIHNTSCPSPPSQQMAVWMYREMYVFASSSFHFMAKRWLHLPASSPGQRSPLSPFSNLHYICDSCEGKTCKLDSKGIIRSCGETFSGSSLVEFT